MSASVLGFIEHARRSGTPMPTSLGASLLNAAARAAEREDRPLRPDLVLVDELGRLSLAPADFAEGPPPPGYVAPEVREGRAPADDPRALVYAVGAFGWHLLVGHAPAEGPSSAAIAGPLGQLVACALSADRKQRYANLPELCHALESVVPRLAPEQERRILTAVAGFALMPPAANGEPASDPAQTRVDIRPFNLVMPAGPVAVSSPPSPREPVTAQMGALADAVLQLEAGMAATSADVTEERGQRLESQATLARRLAALENTARQLQDDARLRAVEQGMRALAEDQLRLAVRLGRRDEPIRKRWIAALLAGLAGVGVGAGLLWLVLAAARATPK